MSSAVIQGDSLKAVSAGSKLRVRWGLLALFLAATFGAWLDAAALFQTPYAAGADGYYYVLQIEALLTRGQFYFPTQTPLILYALAGVSQLTGDPVVSVKVVGIALHTALCLGIFAVVAASTRSLWSGVIAGALTVVLGGHFYMIAEFVKQLGALAFLVWGGWCALRAFDTRKKAWVVLSLACLVAASFSHRSAPALALVVAATAVLTYLLSAESTGGKRRPAAWAALILLWCAPAILASQPFVTLPEWLANELRVVPGLPFSNAAVVEQIILLIVAPATLALVLLKKDESRNRAAAVALGSVALWSLLVTVNPFLDYGKPMSLPWRLSVLAYIQVAVLVPGLLWLIGRHWKVTLLVAAFVLPLVIGSRTHSRPFSLTPQYLAARAAHLQRLPLYRGRLEPNALVISPHGEQFVVTHALGVPSQQKWPGDDTSHTVYWLLHSVRSNFLLPSMIVLMKEGSGTQTILAKDEDVRLRLLNLPEAERRWLRLNNETLAEELNRRAQTQGPESSRLP